MGGRGRVNPAYFSKGPGKKMLEGLTKEQRLTAMAVMVDLNVQPRHLANLERVSVEPPPDTESTDYREDWSYKVLEGPGAGFEGYILGAYQPGDRIVHVRPEWLTVGRVKEEVYPGSYPRASHVFAHELGHHITMRSEWELSSEGAKILNKWERSMGETIVFTQAEADTGLRVYSFSSNLELKADAWKVYQYGSDKQKANLAAYIGVDSLDDIFKE